MYRCQLDFCRFFNKVKLFIDSVLIDWLSWQLKGEGGRAYEVFKNKVKLFIDSVLIDWLSWQLKGEGGRAYEVFNKVKLFIDSVLIDWLSWQLKGEEGGVGGGHTNSVNTKQSGTSRTESKKQKEHLIHC